MCYDILFRILYCFEWSCPCGSFSLVLIIKKMIVVSINVLDYCDMIHVSIIHMQC